MTLELTPLQKHCLSGIGITPWQQRQEVASTIFHAPVNTVVQVQLSDSKVAEPASDYKHEVEDVIPASFMAEIELAINYVMEHNSVKLDWKIDKKASSLSLVNNTIIIPNASEFLTVSDVKKQAWMLISKA